MKKIQTLNEYVLVKDSEVHSSDKDGFAEAHSAVVVSVPIKLSKKLKKGDKIVYKFFRNIRFHNDFECIEFKDIILKHS